MTELMGIVNVTPDSFSDGGMLADCHAAVAHAVRLRRDGAAIIDVGGMSSRPGSVAVDESVEAARVLPVVAGIRAALPDIAISIDTCRPAVAGRALDAGATMINDIAGGRDPAMLALAASRGCGIVLMHMQGEPATMQQEPRYGDAVAEVAAFLAGRRDAALAAGVPVHRIWLDPGIGFGKSHAHNLALLAALPRLAQLGRLLVGVSRKRITAFLAGDETLAPAARDAASHAVHALIAPHCAVLRVHDVAGCRAALAVTSAARAGGIGG